MHFQIDQDQYEILQSENSSKLESLRISTVPSFKTEEARPSLSSSLGSSSALPLSRESRSIIPTLPQQQTNSILAPSTQNHVAVDRSSTSARSETPEGFFYTKRPGGLLRNPTSSSYPNTPVPAALHKPAPDRHYIQPKPRIGNMKVESSITDPKKPAEPYGSPALKISRSSTGLALMNGGGTPPSSSSAAAAASSSPLAVGGAHSAGLPGAAAASARPPNYRSNSSFQRSLQSAESSKSLIPQSQAKLSSSQRGGGFTFHGNVSTNSLVSEDSHAHFDDMEIVPSSFEDDDENGDGLTGFERNYKNSVSQNRSLAPFGGFSNPGIEQNLWNDDNIFDTAEWSIVASDDGNGSLTKAIDISIKDGIINQTKWVGCIAMPSDTISDSVKEDITASMAAEYNCEAVFPEDFTFDGHYKSFCKQILWPTLHYQIPDDPKSKAFEDHSWGHYVLMNKLIADKLADTFIKVNGEDNFDDNGNVIWVHDYHLLLVPKMIRKRLPNVKIGFFLHVSFPSSEVFRCLAQRTELLEGMLGANCISFQTNEYVRHFLQTCTSLLKAKTSEGSVLHNGKLTLVNTIPVGIDSPSLSKIVHSDLVSEWRQLIRDRWGKQNLIISRDKLDKLRGIKQKLLAYEKFLKLNPEFIENTVLIQICIGGGSDPLYELEVMKIISRINSMPDNMTIIQPVVLLNKDIEFDQYLALQCEAEVFIVSSMREGLNLTCHEFITATEDKKSPLILSEFTGSSSLLSCDGEGALLINPWDLKKFSETIYEALTMDKLEKAKRWENCHDFVLTQDSKHWVSECLDSINTAWSRK